jgi:lysyl-tRNA synthetase class 1
VITVSSSAEEFLLIPFVENAFAKFGPAGELRELFMVGDAIGYAALSLELRDKDRQAVESDVAALTFHGSPNVKSPWGTYFRPRSSEPQPDQTTIDSPDIRRLDAESVERWKQRARATDDPVIKARFADVVWDLEQAITGGRGSSVEFATMAVNGYLSTVSEQRYGHPMEATFPLHRALMIATQLNQKELIRTVATRILELGEGASATSPGIWDMPSSVFLENKRIPADLMQRMKDQLEVRLAEASAANNEWAAQVAGTSLLKYLRPVQDRPERQRIVKVIGDVHRRNADGWPSLRAIGLLRSIAMLYEQEALTDEAKDLHLYIEKRGQTATQEMKRFEYTVYLDQEETESQLNKLLTGIAVYPAVFRLAYACLPDPDTLRKFISEAAEQAPISRSITRSYYGSHGLPSSEVGSPEHDPNGNLVELFQRDPEGKMIYLVLGMRTAREKFKFTPSELIEKMLVGSPLFRGDRREFFEQGFSAYENGDYMKTIHVLVPQVEYMMRELLGELGAGKTKPNKLQPHLFDHKNMNDFFREPLVIESIEESLYLFLKSLYIDRRGLNLRNDLAHGIADASAFNEQTAGLVLQSIILLSLPNPAEIYVYRERDE